MNEFFFRVASLAFETSVLAELEKSGSRQIGEVVSEYPSQSAVRRITRASFKNPARRLFQESAATPATCTQRPRRNSPTAASDDGSSSRRAGLNDEKCLLFRSRRLRRDEEFPPVVQGRQQQCQRMTEAAFILAVAPVTFFNQCLTLINLLP